MSTSRRGPAWGKANLTPAPLYPTHLLNEMERHIKYPVGLLPPGATKTGIPDLAKEADRLLLAYLREHVPFLIEALRGANAA